MAASRWVRRRHTPTAVALVLAAIAFSAPAVPAHAAAQTSPASTPLDGERAKMVLVLDSSGSMAEPTGSGETKIAAAKAAMGAVIGQLPADQEVGLRVYGAKVFSRDQAGACTDSQLVVPIALDNRAALRAEIKKYKPFGETPIGYALQEAGKDLGETGRRNIVLVSDGVPTCEPDPCVVARQLAKQGIDLRIDVVGLDVDATARDALKCIADAGNGNYYDATNRAELRDSLISVARRAARPYAPIGQIVVGSPDPATAPTITAGDWQDPNDPPNKDTYYTIERTTPGSTIIASATYRVTEYGGGNDQMNVFVETESGNVCDVDNGVGSYGSLNSAAATASQFDLDEECVTAPALMLHVENLDKAPQTPFEIRISEIPPVADIDALPDAADSSVVWTAPPASQQRTEVTGGTSFADAEALTPGSYRGTIVPGEVLTFTVDADWGQQVAAAFGFPVLRGGNAEVVNNTSMRTNIYSPGRVGAEAAFTEPRTSSSADLLDDGSTKLQATTPEINFANLDSAVVDGSAQAGLYTITLTMANSNDVPSIAVPFTMDLGVTGTAVPGPVFAETSATEPTDTTTDPATDTAEPEASAEPSDSTPAPDTEASDNTDSSGGGPSITVLALGGLGIAALVGALAVALVLARLRRRNTSS